MGGIPIGGRFGPVFETQSRYAQVGDAFLHLRPHTSGYNPGLHVDVYNGMGQKIGHKLVGQ